MLLLGKIVRGSFGLDEPRCMGPGLRCLTLSPESTVSKPAARKKRVGKVLEEVMSNIATKAISFPSKARDAELGSSVYGTVRPTVEVVHTCLDW